MINFITQTNYIKAREISKKSFAYYEKFELKKISKNNEYTKTGVQVFNLSKNLSKEISKLFKNKNKYLKKKILTKKISNRSPHLIECYLIKTDVS